MPRPRKLKQWWQHLTILTCLNSSEAASSIEHAISWSDVDQQIEEYGDDDEGYYEDDVEWNTGDDDELEESALHSGSSDR